MILLLAFILGAAIGSFVGVIATRLYVAPIVNARSKCLSCSHILSWKDMMPIASCLFLRGKCRYCKVRFGYTHALFEIAFGIIFVLLAQKFGIASKTLHFSEMRDLLVQITIAMVLGVIFLYDLRQKIIPRLYLYLFLLLSLVPFFVDLKPWYTAYDIAAPLIVAAPYLLLFLLTMGRGVGFGDVLLFAGVGAALGVDRGLLVFLVSLWVGTITVVPLLLAKVLSKKSSIPFAPFIIIGYFIVYFTGYTLSDLITNLYRLMI